MMPTATYEIQKLKFDQDLFGAWDMNSTLVSVVPLAMFKVSVRTFLGPRGPLVEPLILLSTCPPGRNNFSGSLIYRTYLQLGCNTTTPQIMFQGW